MNVLTKTLKYAAGKVGISINRIHKEPFPELRGQPRYQQRTTRLCGSEFILGDCASFLASYNEIFIRKIYEFHTEKLEPRIIDCGGNFGVSAIFFKEAFPKARLTVVEADPVIATTLKANLIAADAKDVEVINAAVAGTRGVLTFHVEAADGGRVHALSDSKESRKVEAILLDDLIDGPIDFLKIDIEGAETEALLSCSKLNLVSQMFVEYHSFEDSPQSLDQLLQSLSRSGFRYYIQTQICAERPLVDKLTWFGMDLQLNIFAKR